MALAAHHGAFYSGVAPEKRQKTLGAGKWVVGRAEVVDAIRTFFDLDWEDFPARGGGSFPTAPLLLFAGLVTIADWIGSDPAPDRFPYCFLHGINLAHYWAERKSRARRIVAGWQQGQWPLKAGASAFPVLFPFAAANPGQQATLAVARALSGAGLLLIETPTGSGKTEAALAAADIWLSERGATGLYYALPRDAAAGQLFDRLQDFLQNKPGLEATELGLDHAYAARSAEYEVLRARDRVVPRPAGIDGGAQDAIAADWLSGPKRGLLAPFALGTIDEIRLVGLCTKYGFVRLFALAGKVVVIDGVHADDAYSLALLENMLAWFAAINTTVILLATVLPPRKRQALVRAYHKDARLAEEPRYPCVTGVGVSGEVVVRPVVGLSQAPLRIETLRYDREDCCLGIAALLVRRLETGGCAACVLNTVEEAQALFRHLCTESRLEDAELFLYHPRFPLGQRQLLERRLQERFGRLNGRARPRKAVVVTTQALEQGLDVDFDLMISDLAPIDQLLQRAGCLHRHNHPRPNALAEAQLFVLQPDLSETPDIGPSRMVYAPLLLIKTALLLNAGAIQISRSHDLLRLVTRVDEGDEVALPRHLQAWVAEEARAHDRGLVDLAALRWPLVGDARAFFENKGADLEDEEVQSRLGRARITIIVVYTVQGKDSLEAEQLVPVNLKAKEPVGLVETQALLRNGVELDDPEWVRYFARQALPESWRQNALLRHCRLARFLRGELRWRGGMLRISEMLGVEIVEK